MSLRFYTPRQRRHDYAQVFESDAGKRVLADLARVAHIMRPTYVRNEPYQTAFREGERNVVLRILSTLGWQPEEISEKVNQLKENSYE